MIGGRGLAPVHDIALVHGLALLHCIDSAQEAGVQDVDRNQNAVRAIRGV